MANDTIAAPGIVRNATRTKGKSKSHKWRLGADGRGVICPCSPTPPKTDKKGNAIPKKDYHFSMFIHWTKSAAQARLERIAKTQGESAAYVIASGFRAWRQTDEGRTWAVSKNARR